jgi:hypothetical protein
MRFLFVRFLPKIYFLIFSYTPCFGKNHYTRKVLTLIGYGVYFKN